MDFFISFFIMFYKTHSDQVKEYAFRKVSQIHLW